VTISLTASHYFHLSHATNLHDDLFYSIMRVWHSDRVSHLAFAGVALTVASTSRSISWCCFYCLQRRYGSKSEGYKWRGVKGKYMSKHFPEEGDLLGLAALCVRDVIHGGT
jgi:hypothetical protein